jgi:RNA recognition motif-containing protein
MKKLFVGSISFNSTEESLKQKFEEIGPVSSAKIIFDRFSGRSKGFGFVEMENDEDAAKAIEQLNGSMLDGREIVVNEAKPEGERTPRRFDDRRN